MSKTMVEIINSHAKHGLRGGQYVCHGKGCDHVYPAGLGYPESVVVTAHVVNRLNAAGFGSKHDAWADGAKAGWEASGEGWNAEYSCIPFGDASYDAWPINPHPVTR